ncbi:MAG: hypothetical protein HQM09_08725 [Candidatus Riflebacteria bacterium]|nr:hypothetical protein [Candidatus Riflebacteria bacterium]
MRIQERLQRFGFRLGKGGVHAARTIMTAELHSLLTYVNDPKATVADYKRAVEQDNCLGKRSAVSRNLTYRHLTELYGLSSECPIFRIFSFFWNRQPESRNLLALLISYARDALLRAGAPIILAQPAGTIFNRETLEKKLDDLQQGRFSKATLTSVSQNISSSFTQSGHLHGRIKKTRTRPQVSPGAVSYALFLSFLQGARGENIFTSEYVALLDCSVAQAMECAEEASRRGWIVFKRVGKVVEVVFPNLLTPLEVEWLREQN